MTTWNAWIPGAAADRSSRLLAAAVALLVAGLAWHGPIAQWADYHHFADDRTWLGLPHAANVLSNLPFLAIGIAALWRWRRQGQRGLPAGPSSFAWRCFALALVGTAFGSAAYHLAPADSSLVGDRLPIAWACASLVCAFLGERVDARWAMRRVVAAALALASASVLAWVATGDLRAYLFVQFLPMLLVPLGLALRLAPATRPAVPATAWWTVLACYAAAKVFELADASVYAALGSLSGHTLKHLLAAAGAATLLSASVGDRTD